MFWKIGDLKNFAKFTGKQLRYGLELYQRPATLLIEVPAQVFCCNCLQIFQEYHFYRTPPGDCFRNTKIKSFYCNRRKVTSWNSLFERTIYFIQCFRGTFVTVIFDAETAIVSETRFVLDCSMLFFINPKKHTHSDLYKSSHGDLYKLKIYKDCH